MRATLKDPVWGAGNGGQVHAGFHDALDESWAIVESALQAAIQTGRPIWLCGHSLGGALAVLAAHRLAAGKPSAANVAALYTYGQPRCGNQPFMSELETAIGNRHYRSVNNRDIVPLVPPPEKPWPYVHGGQVAYFNEFGDFVLNPPLWYRALDKVELSADQLKAKLKQTVGDHDMSGYVRLYRDAVRISS